MFTLVPTEGELKPGKGVKTITPIVELRYMSVRERERERLTSKPCVSLVNLNWDE